MDPKARDALPVVGKNNDPASIALTLLRCNLL
jgi:hypothetical protein